MKNTVIIKGNRYGIAIVLDPEVPFAQLLKDLESRLENAEEFFDSDKQLAVTFEGRKLNNHELEQMLTVIESCSRLNIQYVMDENSDLEATFFDIIQSDVSEKTPIAEDDPVEVSGILASMQEKTPSDETPQRGVNRQRSVGDDGLFYRGTLRSGQTLESKSSVVMIGDVNPGATVIAGGNVVVIGALKGTVCAGMNGHTDAFVMALDMEPIQIRIADRIARSPDTGKHTHRKSEPMIATVADQQIALEPISKSVIQDIKEI